MVKKILLVIITWILSLHVYSQYLKIGDTLPDLTLSGVLNYSDSNLSTASFRGKLIILDFWNHRCIPCLQALPKLDSLQKVFKEKIQIILVNTENKDSTKNFFSKRKKIRQPDIPMVTGDTILLSLFPVNGYPYSVWINEVGIIKYFSSTQNITALNIKDVISGRIKKLSDPTVVTPGLFNTNKLVEYSSSLSLCNDSVNITDSQKEIINYGRSVRIASNCSSVLGLYKKAYKEYDKFNIDTEYGTVIEIRDNSKLNYLEGVGSDNRGGVNNRFNYELIIPTFKSDERYKIMQQDLNRYFDFSGEIEMRNVKSIIIKKDSNHARLLTKGELPSINFRSEDYGVVSTDTLFHIINQPFHVLIKNLEAYTRYYYPLYDEAGVVDNNIDIQIRKSSLVPLNVDSLNYDLQKVGLNLIIEQRKIPVLVLREKLVK